MIRSLYDGNMMCYLKQNTFIVSFFPGAETKHHFCINIHQSLSTENLNKVIKTTLPNHRFFFNCSLRLRTVFIHNSVGVHTMPKVSFKLSENQPLLLYVLKVPLEQFLKSPLLPSLDNNHSLLPLKSPLLCFRSENHFLYCNTNNEIYRLINHTEQQKTYLSYRVVFMTLFGKFLEGLLCSIMNIDPKIRYKKQQRYDEIDEREQNVA